MKHLIITLTDNEELQVKSNEPLTIYDVTDLTLSAVMSMMNSILENTPQDQKVEMKEYLFQVFNVAASALLAQFAPDIDLRPDITEEAILEQELNLALKSHDSNH